MSDTTAIQSLLLPDGISWNDVFYDRERNHGRQYVSYIQGIAVQFSYPYFICDGVLFNSEYCTPVARVISGESK